MRQAGTLGMVFGLGGGLGLVVSGFLFKNPDTFRPAQAYRTRQEAVPLVDAFNAKLAEELQLTEDDVVYFD